MRTRKKNKKRAYKVQQYYTNHFYPNNYTIAFLSGTRRTACATIALFTCITLLLLLWQEHISLTGMKKDLLNKEKTHLRSMANYEVNINRLKSAQDLEPFRGHLELCWLLSFDCESDVANCQSKSGSDLKQTVRCSCLLDGLAQLVVLVGGAPRRRTTTALCT